MSRLFFFHHFFDGRKDCSVKTSDSGHNSIYFGDSLNEEFEELLEYINTYLGKTGVADFSLIQGKTERILDSKYEHSTAFTSFPTLIGLIGTFFGVVCGLYAFNQGLDIGGDGNTLITDKNISELIFGVIISMITSVVGLLLMIASQIFASKYKKDVEVDRDEFYDFIQTEVMSVDSKDVASAVSKLNYTIGAFVAAFETGSANFNNAFTDNSDKFTKAFKDGAETILKAVGQIKTTTDAVGSSLTEQKAIVDRQVALVEEIKSAEISETMQAFIDSAKKFADVIDAMQKLESYKTDVINATTQLVNVQKDYLSSLDTPMKVAESLSGILDRVKTFEASINNLGKDVAQTQLLGNKEMNLITEELNAIKKKSNLAASYHNTADDKLEEFYKDQITRLGSLMGKFDRTLSDYGTQFDKMMEQVLTDMKTKRDSLAKVLNESFNVGDAANDLKNLNTIPDIKMGIEEISITVEKTSPEYLDKKFIELKSAIDSLVNKLNQTSSASINAEMKDTLSQLNNTLAQFIKRKSFKSPSRKNKRKGFLFFRRRNEE